MLISVEQWWFILTRHLTQYFKANRNTYLENNNNDNNNNKQWLVTSFLISCQHLNMGIYLFLQNNIFGSKLSLPSANKNIRISSCPIWT